MVQVLRLVEALKVSGETGAVCPASWARGGTTIQPQVTDQTPTKYFLNHHFLAGTFPISLDRCCQVLLRHPGGAGRHGVPGGGVQEAAGAAWH